MPINSGTTYCDNMPLFLVSSSTPIDLPPIKNDFSLLYDEVQIGFYLYYTPSEWQSAKPGSIIIRLNQVEIMRLTGANLTNKGTTNCNSFNNLVARIEIFSGKIVHTDNVVGITVEVIGGGTVGVGNVKVKSLKKNPPSPPADNATVPVNNTTVPVNNTTTPVNNTTTPVNNSVPAVNSSTPIVVNPEPTVNNSSPVTSPASTTPTVNDSIPQQTGNLPNTTNSSNISHISQGNPSTVTPAAPQEVPAEVPL